MIQRVRIKDFQSLADVELELGQLTVIVGPSSSGKSALIRALRLLTSNKAGTSYVRRGRPQCSVAADVSGGKLGPVTVEIRRGKESFYQYQPQSAHQDLEAFRYTKIAAAVPEKISELLGIPPGDQPNFAGQFDRPYLLDDTGSKVAQTLGELTNIVIVMAAAREANRLRLGTAAKQRDSQQILQQLDAQLPAFADLPNQSRILDNVDSLLAELELEEHELRQLKHSLEELGTIEVALNQPLPAILDLEDLDKERSEIAQLQQLMQDVDHFGKVVASNQQEIDELVPKIAECDNVYRNELEVAGVCPTCGQEIKEIHVHAEG